MSGEVGVVSYVLTSVRLSYSPVAFAIVLFRNSKVNMVVAAVTSMQTNQPPQTDGQRESKRPLGPGGFYLFFYFYFLHMILSVLLSYDVLCTALYGVVPVRFLRYHDGYCMVL